MAGDEEVRDLAIYLVELIRHGDTIYLHGWNGHGRTGTVVCIMLYLMYGLNATQVLHRCQYLHDLRKMPMGFESPQTAAQREQVVRVIERMLLDDLVAALLKAGSDTEAKTMVSCWREPWKQSFSQYSYPSSCPHAHSC